MHRHPPSKSHILAMQRCQAKCHAQTHDQHGVAAWLAQDTSDAGDVLHGVHEEYYGRALEGWYHGKAGVDLGVQLQLL